MNGKITTYLELHFMLMVYSMSGICSKMAAKQEFLSIRFCLFYGMLIILLGAYAVAWQQIIKKLPLTSAYANRAATIIWGAVWGRLVFHEHISFNTILGIVLVVIGVVVYTFSDSKESVENN